MFESFIGVNFWTALFVLLNTLLLVYVAKKYLFVPVKNMIDSRQKEIDSIYADAGAAREQAKVLQSEYQQKLSAARKTGEQFVKAAIARGQSREEEIIRQANADAAAIMDKAASAIAREKKKAINDAKNEIAELSLAIAGKVVGRELKKADQEALIDHFIDQLGDDL